MNNSRALGRRHEIFYCEDEGLSLEGRDWRRLISIGLHWQGSAQQWRGILRTPQDHVQPCSTLFCRIAIVKLSGVLPTGEQVLVIYGSGFFPFAVITKKFQLFSFCCYNHVHFFDKV